MQACREGNVVAVKYLMAKGALLNIQTKYVVLPAVLIVCRIVCYNVVVGMGKRRYIMLLNEGTKFWFLYWWKMALTGKAQACRSVGVNATISVTRSY